MAVINLVTSTATGSEEAVFMTVSDPRFIWNCPFETGFIHTKVQRSD